MAFAAETVNKDNLDEYEDFIKRHPKGLFQHSSKWAKVKSAWKWEALMLKDESGNIKGSAAALIRTVPVINYSLFYVCRGFVADEDDAEVFDALFDALLKLAKKYKAYCIKIDPEITVENKEYKRRLLDKGFIELNPGCLDFENVQPRFVYCFDYNGLNEEELMDPEHKNMGKSSMSFITALSLSFNNLKTKKARTLLTAFAGSIGIIGIALILSLSTGVNDYIQQIEEETLSEYPLQIQSTGFDFSSALETGGIPDSEDQTGDIYVVEMVTDMFSTLDTNDLESLKSYLDSGESGVEGLDLAALKALRAHVEAAAAKGDMEAKMLLQSWK